MSLFHGSNRIYVWLPVCCGFLPRVVPIYRCVNFSCPPTNALAMYLWSSRVTVHHGHSIMLSRHHYTVLCVAIATSEMKATVAARVHSSAGLSHHDTVHGTYMSLSFSCLPHIKWNDLTTLVRAGGTCVNTTDLCSSVAELRLLITLVECV